MNPKELKRSYFYKGVTAFCVIAAALLFYFFLFRIEALWNYGKNIIGVLQPVIFGLVIAYLVNPIVNLIQKWLFPVLKKHCKTVEKAEKITNIISVFAALILFVLLIVGLIALVIPQFIVSISNALSILPGKLDAFTKWTADFLKSNEKMETILTKVLEYEKNWLQNDLTEYVNKWAAYFASGVIDAINFIKNFAVGIIFAIYLLLQKKRYARKCCKVIAAVFRESTVQKILRGCRKSHAVFSGFINGALTDSFIVAVLCFIGVSILRIPYAMLIAIVIGLTNTIPVFGPYIGGIPCAVLVLLTNPLKGLYFIIFVILLQALDGNVIAPKILGDRTGLETFWVVFAIVLGGGMFGVIGMLIGVPLFAVLYSVVQAFINHLLKKKKMPVSDECYTVDVLIDGDASLNAKKEESDAKE